MESWRAKREGKGNSGEGENGGRTRVISHKRLIERLKVALWDLGCSVSRKRRGYGRGLGRGKGQSDALCATSGGLRSVFGIKLGKIVIMEGGDSWGGEEVGSGDGGGSGTKD